MASTYLNKYDRKGAYHWDDYYGGLLRTLNTDVMLVALVKLLSMLGIKIPNSAQNVI